VPAASGQRAKPVWSFIASVDLDECISRLYKKEVLAESVIEAICAKTKELLMRESNVIHVQAPITVVGDIHGQFYDLIEIFKIGGFCPDTNYLFLGKGPAAVSTINPRTYSVGTWGGGRGTLR
jgi:hypothetical protein